MKVEKRNGELVDFDLDKIAIAIGKAFDEFSLDFEDTQCLHRIEEKIKIQYSDIVSVEQIQDIVEKTLFEFGYFDIAREYIKYRNKHEMMRLHFNDEQIFSVIGREDGY